MGTEGAPKPEEKNKEPVNRREFLGKAGKFISGGLAAASIGERVYKVYKEKREIHKTPERFIIFDFNLLLKELDDVRKKHGLAWEEEARKRFEAGALRAAEYEREKSRADEKDKAGTSGIMAGALPPLVKLCWDLHNDAFLSQETWIKRLNALGLSAGTGNLLGRALSRSESADGEKQFVRDAVDMAFQLLPSSESRESSDQGNAFDHEFQKAVLKNTVHISPVFSKQLNLKSQLELWAAGIVITLQEIAQKAKKVKQ